MSTEQANEARKITLAGNKFIAAGRLPGYTKSTASTYLLEQGGSLTWALGKDDTDTIALVGMNPSSKLMDKILARGLTVVEGDALVTLLSEGEVTLEKEEGESLDALIGKARSLLGETPSSQAWADITALVDRCSDEHLDDFIAYLEPQISRWSVGARGNQVDQYFSGKDGELRVAPKTWLAAILAGDRSPKYRLVHGINLGAVSLKDAIATKLFQTDQLPNWRAFDIGRSHSSSRRGKAFFQAMQEAKNLEKLESLTVRGLEGFADELGKVGTMPALKALVVENAPGEVFKSAWACNLETLHLDMRDLPDFLGSASNYTALRELRLTISSHYYNKLDPAVCFAAHKVWGQLETVLLLQGEAHAMRAFCQRLGEAGGVKTLDLSACLLDISGGPGVELLDELLVQTNMAESLERVIISERFDATTVTRLEELGLEVFGPDGTPYEASQQSGEAQWSPHALAAGEEERRARGLLDVTDALLYEEPGWEAWEVVVGVADGLREQLPPDEFDEAMQSLAAALEPWPVTFRRLPLTWSGLLDIPAFDTRLLLVKTLDLDRLAIDDQARAKVNMLQHIAQSPHIGIFEHLTLNARSAQKGILDAYDQLIDAMKPAQVALGSYYKGKDKEKVATFLNGKGIEVFQPRWDYSQPIKAESLADEMAQRAHLNIRLMTSEELLTLVSVQDLDHVVSLKLSVGQYSNPSEIPFEIPEDLADHVVAASWKRLRRLEVEINGMPSDHALEPFARVADAFAAWLSNARPVVVRPALNPTAADVVFSHKIVEAGVYGRAYGGSLDVHLVEAPERWQELLGNENLRASMVEFNHSGWMRSHFQGGEYIDSLSTLAEAMHPNLRANLKVLKGPMGSDDLEQLEETMQLFPQLALLCSFINFFPEGRGTLLDAFASSPSTRKLSAFLPVIGSGYGRDNARKPLDKKEQARLQKGDGLIPERFMVVSNSILSNYL